MTESLSPRRAFGERDSVSGISASCTSAHGSDFPSPAETVMSVAHGLWQVLCCDNAWYNEGYIDHRLCPVSEERKERVNPHVHISATHLLASVAAVVAVMGTIHLLALTNDNRASRAWVALGF